jgi:hypothetical protein
MWEDGKSAVHDTNFDGGGCESLLAQKKKLVNTTGLYTDLSHNDIW